MRLDHLKKAAAQARAELYRAEGRAQVLQDKFRTAWVRVERLQQQHRQAQKSAATAKRAALAAEAKVYARLRVWEDAQQRLAQALPRSTKTGRRGGGGLVNSHP